MSTYRWRCSDYCRRQNKYREIIFLKKTPTNVGAKLTSYTVPRWCCANGGMCYQLPWGCCVNGGMHYQLSKCTVSMGTCITNYPGYCANGSMHYQLPKGCCVIGDHQITNYPGDAVSMATCITNYPGYCANGSMHYQLPKGCWINVDSHITKYPRGAPGSHIHDVRTETSFSLVAREAITALMSSAQVSMPRCFATSRCL